MQLGRKEGGTKLGGKAGGRQVMWREAGDPKLRRV